MDSGTGTPMGSSFSALAPRLRLRPLVALGRGWVSFRTHVGISLGVSLALFCMIVVGEILPFVNLFFMLFAAPALYAGGARFMVRVARGESPGFESVLDGFKRWPSVTGAVLLQMLVMFAILAPVFVAIFATVGLRIWASPAPTTTPPLSAFLPFVGAMLVCYPAALWWGCRTWPAFMVVMEPESTGAIAALRLSWKLTRGSVWRTIGLFLLGLPLEIVGLLALCVGVVPAMIVWYYAFAHAYEQLRERAGIVNAVAAPAATPPEPPPTHPILAL